MRCQTIALFLSLGCIAPAAAQYDELPKPLSAVGEAVVQGSDFLHFHPDIRHRNSGMASYDAGDVARAVSFFERAARFSDKPSQAMLGEILWKGDGVAQDRELAYVWMDLAAERGSTVFLSLREHYWSALSNAERQRAVTRGAALYAEFGDAVAKRRLEQMLRKRRMQFTGSRVGHVSPGLRVLVADAAGVPRPVPAHQVYDERFWQADKYFEWQDEVWGRPPVGTVEVGPLSRDATQAPPRDSTSRD